MCWEPLGDVAARLLHAHMRTREESAGRIRASGQVTGGNAQGGLPQITPCDTGMDTGEAGSWGRPRGNGFARHAAGGVHDCMTEKGASEPHSGRMLAQGHDALRVLAE